MNEEQSKFEGWAVVEIFGHQRYAGYVTTQAFGQAVMFRVDVPPLDERERVTKHYEYVEGHNVPPGSTVKEAAIPGYSKLFGVGSIYAITPCDEAAGMKALAAMQTRRLQLVTLAQERALEDGRILDEADPGQPYEGDDEDDDRDDGDEEIADDEAPL